MKGILGEFAGGIVIIVLSAAVGIAQNSLRSNPVPLIQHTQPAATTASVPDTPADATDMDADTSGTEATDTAATTGEKKQPAKEGEVSLAEAKKLFDSGIAIFLDARAPDAYAEGHIPGAINIPYDQLPQYLETLQNQVMQTDVVVCYCWSPTCDFSEQLATELRIMQYKNVKEFTGGWEQWTDAGYPAESGE